MTREELKRQIKDKEFGLAPDAEPNCFGIDQEVIWWKIGAREGFDKGFEFADANPVNPWHSVKDRLPEYQKRYFVRMEDDDGSEHYGYIPYFCKDGWWYPASLSMCRGLKVTHWMPIPELPKEKED